MDFEVSGQKRQQQQPTERKEQQMKKLIAIAAMAMLVGATGSKAQVIITNDVDTIVRGPLNVDIKVQLSDKTSPAVTGVKWAEVQEVVGSVTDRFQVLGTTIIHSDVSVDDPGVGTNTLTNTLSTNVFLFGDDPVGTDSKFVEALFGQGAGPFGMSNAVWLATGSIKSTKGTNVTLKAQGIWKEGTTSFKASVKTSKTQ
jgi:hypothetical protein